MMIEPMHTLAPRDHGHGTESPTPAAALPARPAPADPVLEARHVTAGYRDKTILHALNLHVCAGEIYALLGGNGAGKTTTLSLLLGLIAPKSGSLRVNGIDPSREPGLARRQLAYIPENVALYEHLTARENLSYLLDLARQEGARDAIEPALTAAGLAPSAWDQRVTGFSKGMRQKVAIALALARQVPALLLDEPTSGLDPQATAEFHRALGVLRERGVAILMVTHDLLSAADVADRIGFLSAGRLSEVVSSDAGRSGGLGPEASAIPPERFDVRALYRRYTQGGEACASSF